MDQCRFAGRDVHTQSFRYVNPRVGLRSGEHNHEWLSRVRALAEFEETRLGNTVNRRSDRMALKIDPRSIAPRRRLLYGLVGLRKFLDRRPCEEFLELREPQIQCGLCAVEGDLGAVEEVGRGEPSCMDFANAVQLALPELELLCRTLDAGARSGDLFRSRAAHEFVKTRLCLPEYGFGLGESSSRPGRILLDKYIASSYYITLGDGDADDGLVAFGRQFDAIRGQFANGKVSLFRVAAGACEQGYQDDE